LFVIKDFNLISGYSIIESTKVTTST
jgi:hypothetical protein